MITKKAFRMIVLSKWALIISYILIVVLSVVFDFELLPENMIAINEEIARMSQLTNYDYILFAIVITMYLVSSIGMMLFKNWARYLYLIAVIINALSVLIDGGATLESDLDSLFSAADSFMEGFILALAYFSNVKEFFTDKENVSE